MTLMDYFLVAALSFGCGVISSLVLSFFTSGLFMDIVEHGWRNDR